MDLLDLLIEQEQAGDPRHEWKHACMPNMAYACGGNIVDGLPDGGPRGRMHLGGWSVHGWAEISCPDCRAGGLRELGMRAHRQQTDPHDCDPDNDDRCAHAASLPDWSADQWPTGPDPQPSSPRP